MDNLKFGAFVAQLRKELNLTQKDLAERLNVTDKAVSKWETGKGFPDVKLLEPLAQILGVSLVELIRSERQTSEHLTVEEAEQVISQAMDQSQTVTARKYLKMFRWTLTGISLFCVLHLFPRFLSMVVRLYYEFILRHQYGVIGSADGPTAILVATRTLTWLDYAIPFALLLFCISMALRIRKLENDLS